MQFIKICEAMGMKDCIKEYRFHPKRRWRCDYFFPIGLVIEIEGGTFSHNGFGGRHNRGVGFRNDMIKYSALTEAGIWLLRYPPETIDYDQIKRVYDKLVSS